MFTLHDSSSVLRQLSIAKIRQIGYLHSTVNSQKKKQQKQKKKKKKKKR